MMKSNFIVLIFLVFYNSFAQEVYESDLYEFQIKGDTFELHNRYDIEEELYERRKSFCPLIAKGYIKKEDKFYYSLRSIHSSEEFKSKIVKSEYRKELEDSLSITIKILNVNKLDINNFIFSSIYNVQIQEDNDDCKLVFKAPKLWTHKISLLAYPKNENLLLTDDVISISFSNQLVIDFFRYDLSSLKHYYNDFYFEIENFNPCNLYLKYFDGDFVKIKNNKLYWKDMVFLKK
ncbi:hypothetical protein MG290_12090 [Flavobacterium sp. CBA20B-1]|uniref:hypothetical protein n=1 Tax=unclassified Flavobacterium TaxID=196869 RepID=UPI002224D9B7|nr:MULTISPECIES: hypothetical protein [unclassified Flavobacterium]WCM41679.1 hypothetical protein MG290_12090 [Flavobacterium sp. CBA20B-1]